ncbi:MAG: type II secretion system protein [Patescibacteria group bacterium]|nr:type II secretion system GspH family protein [Patescibacteria group bacterium]MBU1160322.1 type II secretion system GspH family protein [Patescibacteria group bacterium]MBU1683994.1 type II secretion system GspH family protein [Patescibacteria group bacterium]MBU1778172.1 type II secretion system GspH family protein [Patescibacteria group bacterium]MBU1987629.1 type II secretion system GspH family protein [Patescibacteria group bacterium]
MLKNKHGFSLIELIIVIGIFSTITIVWMSFYIKGLQLFPFILKQSQSVEDAQNSVETMVREIRNTDNGEDGSNNFALASDYTLIFYSDINKDGLTDKIRYFIENEKFKKAVIYPTGWPLEYLPENEEITILAKNIMNTSTPIFYYYDGDNNILPTQAILTKTKMIKVKMKIDNGRPENYNLESYVQIRNVKDNL